MNVPKETGIETVFYGCKEICTAMIPYELKKMYSQGRFISNQVYLGTPWFIDKSPYRQYHVPIYYQVRRTQSCLYWKMKEHVCYRLIKSHDQIEVSWPVERSAIEHLVKKVCDDGIMESRCQNKSDSHLGSRVRVQSPWCLTNPDIFLLGRSI